MKTIKEFLEKSDMFIVETDMYDKCKDELNIDLTKEAYTFEELERIARVVTNIPIQWVMFAMNHNIDNCIEHLFEDAIRDGNVAIIKNLILGGYVKSVGKYLYLDMGKNDLHSNHLIDENMYEPMFQLLLKNNEYDLARKISTNKFFYEKEELDEEYTNYLLGEKVNGANRIRTYVKEAYKLLNEESKIRLEKIIIDNYKCILDEIKTLKAKGNIIQNGTVNGKYFLIEKGNELLMYVYYSAKVYEEFGDDSKKLILSIIDEIDKEVE